MLTLLRSLGVACLALLLSVGLAHAVDIDLTNADGSKTKLKGDGVNGAANVYKSAQDGGEHLGATEAEGYQRVIVDVLSSGQKTADAQIKASAGYVSHMICQGSDAAAVAGTIIIHDALTETGTAIFTFTVAALDYHVPMVFPINVQAATGIYLGYTTTTDVACTVFYR